MVAPGVEIPNTAGNNNGSLDYSSSPLYQNPGWPTTAGGSAEAVSGF